MDYDDFEARLRRHFEGERTGNVRKLQAFRQGSLSLGDYNTKFNALAAGAVGGLSDLTVKDLYVAGLASDTVRAAMAPSMHKSLQKLQARAMDYLHVVGQKKGQATTFPRDTRTQNPYRVQCQKCNKWHNPSKGETCLCSDKQQ